MESEKIKMKAPNGKGGFTEVEARYIEHAERMISMFNYELADDRYEQQGKQVVKKKAKKKKKETDAE